METLTANLAGKSRHEEWNGRQYLVVPLTMLVPGVLSGSKGPLLYPADEVRKSPDDWNHIPIVVYHPMKDGKPVSARSPSILSKYGVGFVFHSRTDSKGVLKGEGWLDVEATRRVDKSVLDSVQLGNPIELSTGLFVDDEPAPEGAIFNDHRGQRKYVGIARNYKPDHLAILPSGKGACSLADGCGVLINEAAMEAYQVIVNELEAEAVSLYFPDLDLDLLTANKFNPNQPRDKAGRFATVGQATKAVEKAQGRVTKAQAALEKAKATLKVEKSGLLTAKKGLSEAKAREKAKSPAATRAIGKAKASTGTAPKGRATKTATAAGPKSVAASNPVTPKASKTPASTGKGSKVAQSIVGAINGGASNLKEAYNAVKKDHPDVTLGQFHDHVKALHESGHIEAQSYNKHLASLPSNEHAIYHKNRVLYDVAPGSNTAPVKSTVEHKALPKNLTDKLAAFVSDARAKNSFDTPSIARAHEHLRQFAPHITEGQLHDVVRQAHAEGKVRLNPYTQAPATIGTSEKPFYMDHDIKNYLDAGPNLKAGVGAAAGAKSTAASTAAKADSTPDFHTLAHTTHEANKQLTHPTTGLPPVIPRLYEEVARMHPGLKEKDFHEHLRELQKRDIATQQVWDTSVKITPENTGGYTADRFPLGGRSGIFPIGWVAFRHDAASRINADAGRAKASAGTASPRSTSTAPKPAASPRAGKSGKSVDEHHAETEALTRSPMSHQEASKAVDSHITNLNKSLNKAQAHELGQKLGLTHPKSATKKSVLDKIKTHIHARRGAHH